MRSFDLNISPETRVMQRETHEVFLLNVICSQITSLSTAPLFLYPHHVIPLHVFSYSPRLLVTQSVSIEKQFWKKKKHGNVLSIHYYQPFLSVSVYNVTVMNSHWPLEAPDWTAEEGQWWSSHMHPWKGHWKHCVHVCVCWCPIYTACVHLLSMPFRVNTTPAPHTPAITMHRWFAWHPPTPQPFHWRGIAALHTHTLTHSNTHTLSRVQFTDTRKLLAHTLCCVLSFFYSKQFCSHNVKRLCYKAMFRHGISTGR